MTDISEAEAKALIAVLSLAENHQMWSDPRSQAPALKGFLDTTYAAIGTVRLFLKRNGIVTMHELTERLASQAEQRAKAAPPAK